LLTERDCQVEDDTEVKVAEAEMDEVDTALRQSRRKYDVRRKHSGGRSRLGKMLNNYKMKLDFRCNCTCTVQQAVLLYLRHGGALCEAAIRPAVCLSHAVPAPVAQNCCAF